MAKPVAPSWDEWLAGTGLAADQLVAEAKKALSFLADDAPTQQIEEKLSAFVADIFTNRLPELKGRLMVELPKFVLSGKGPVKKSPTDGVV